MLENIQALLQQIDQTKQDSEVFECYQTGLVTLKKVFKETGLNEESVCNTMEQLEDILNSKKDIEEALSKPLDHNQDQILEDELTELLLMEVPEVPAESLEATELQKREKKKEQELKNKMQALSI